MIEMRLEQYEVFERQAQSDFQQRAIEQLREGMPEEVASFSDDELRKRVNSAMKRAEQYDLETEIEVLYFLNAAVLLDDDQFDENPRFPWALEILEGDLDSEEKAEAVFDAAFDFCEARDGRS